MEKPVLHLLCNAHLDPVWQWRWEEGCAEALSTFGTAAQILEEHPGLIFNHNESVLYRWVLEHAPDLFREIQKLAAEGRWCIAGGWYLQPDLNLPDTESLIRCMAEGRRFFKEHFGVEPKVACNFDSFGHSAGLPQLLVRAGFDFYIHMRPQQAEMELPSDLYRWRGLDGSEVGALRIAVGLYHTERHNMRQRLEQGAALALKLNRDVPVFWGIGDHGGGPTREDLQIIDEFAQEEKRVQVRHSSVEQLWEALKPCLAQAPLIEGGLQRVFTGCYTSLSRLKRQSQTSLCGLVQAEMLRVMTWWELGQSYPAEAFDEAWRKHLFNDFHDILPGSCIQPAEQDALNLYGAVDHRVRELRLSAATALNQGAPSRLHIPVTVLNANPACCAVPVEVEAMLDLRPKWSGRWHLRLFRMDGAELPCQEEQPEALLPFNGWRRKITFCDKLPQVGVAHYELRMFQGDAKQQAHPPALAHEIDSQSGLVCSLKTAAGQECLRGPLLEPLVVEDDGDAWGADRWSYRNILGRFEAIKESIRIVEQGPVRTITEAVLVFGHSKIVFHTIAYADWSVLEFRLRVHWNEERKRLKLVIPSNLANPVLRCEVPGGVTQNPADAQEHVHRRWLTLTGTVEHHPTSLAIINNGQNAYDFSEGEVRLSALRSAAYCHEQGFKLESWPARKFMDQGVHDVRLLVTAGVPEEVRSWLTGFADWLSAPPVAYAHLPIGAKAPTNLENLFLAIQPTTNRLLACKQSCDGQGLVLRVQELAGQATEGKITFTSSTVRLAFAPYEIKTIRFERDGSWREVHMVWET